MDNETLLKKMLEKQDEIIRLQKHALIVSLYKGGATMDQIKKNLHIKTDTVVEMLKGITREK